MHQNYLESIHKQFQFAKSLGDKTFTQLPDEGLFWQNHPENNSIAVIVKHLWGNMLSRWTDFLSSDGEKEWRDRDAEFEADIQNREELIEKWEAGWACLFQALDSLNPEDLTKIIYIRNIGHTVVEAINRQLAHYSYHTGQIVMLGKMFRGQDWQSLSVAKGASKQYNASKFSQPKHRGHFTDEYLPKNKES